MRVFIAGMDGFNFIRCFFYLLRRSCDVCLLFCCRGSSHWLICIFEIHPCDLGNKSNLIMVCSFLCVIGFSLPVFCWGFFICIDWPVIFFFGCTSVWFWHQVSVLHRTPWKCSLLFSLLSNSLGRVGISSLYVGLNSPKWSHMDPRLVCKEVFFQNYRHSISISSDWCVQIVCFLTPVLEGCVITETFSFLLGCPIYWDITVHSISLWFSFAFLQYCYCFLLLFLILFICVLSLFSSWWSWPEVWMIFKSLFSKPIFGFMNFFLFFGLCFIYFPCDLYCCFLSVYFDFFFCCCCSFLIL